MLLHFKSKLVILFLLVSSLSVGVARAQTFIITGHRKAIHVPFRIIRNMIVIKADINGEGPFYFILDTGVGYMVITDPEVVKSVDIIRTRTIKMSGLGEGRDLDAYVTNPLQIDIGGLTNPNLAAAIFKEDHFGLSNYAGMPIAGLIGYDFFNGLTVKIDFADSTLTAFNPNKFKLKKKYTGVPISIEGNKPYLTAHIKMKDSSQRDCKLIVDLGAGHPLSLENMHTETMGALKSIPANLGMGLNGLICGRISRVSELDIGQFVFKDVLASFPEENKNYIGGVKRDGSLGIDILKRFHLIIDYPHNMIYFKPRTDLKEPFEHDMSGMEYYSGGDGLKHVIIASVEPGSAADKVGLSKDDELISINFKPVNKMSLDDIDAIFRSRDGLSLLLEVVKDNKYGDVVIILKKRI